MAPACDLATAACVAISLSVLCAAVFYFIICSSLGIGITSLVQKIIFYLKEWGQCSPYVFPAARLALAQGISLSVSTGPGAPGTETENSQEGSTTKVNGEDSSSPDNKQTSMEVDNDDSKVCEIICDVHFAS